MTMDMKEKDLPERGPHDKDGAGEKEKESLKDEMRNVIEEARMVIPGIQALFGFQTMGVFNNRFEDIADSSKLIYLAALGLLVVSMGLLMTPAAYHRLVERGQISRKMIDLSSTLIATGMIPLMLALAFDVYVVVVTAFDTPQAGIAAAIATVILFACLWFLMPLVAKRSR